MKNRNEPIGYTCPDIDHCLQSLKHAQECIQEALSIGENEFPFDVVFELKQAISFIDLSSELEKLRTANETLRSWGNEIFDKLDKEMDETDELHKTIQSLKNDVEDLKYTITSETDIHNS